MKECVKEFCKSLIEISGVTNIMDYISVAETVSKIILNVLGVVVGIIGINYFRKIRQKDIDAVFSYYAKLKVRLHILKHYLEQEKDEIMNRFIIPDLRPEPDLSRINSVANSIKSFLAEVVNTKEFLENADDQLPASKDWVKQYDLLLIFLEECKKLEVESYYKWDTKNVTDINDFYNLHYNNLCSMLDAITKKQERIQQRIYNRF